MKGLGIHGSYKEQFYTLLVFSTSGATVVRFRVLFSIFDATNASVRVTCCVSLEHKGELFEVESNGRRVDVDDL